MEEESTDHKKLIEAALFMSPKAMSLDELVASTGIASRGILQQLLDELVQQYATADTALSVFKIGDKYMFSLKEPYASKVAGLASGPDISRGALRILAYISKNDGVLQSSVVKNFGSSVYDYIKELTEKEFIETQKIGRSKKITTTDKFKEYFNV